MFRSVFVMHTLPFLFWFLSFVGLALLIDYLLHLLNLDWVGRYLGPAGTVLLIVSFIYSLRKRKIITTGSPKILLQFHEYMAWVGSVLILVHAGIHYNALVPWLAILAMLVAVAFGLIGKYVLKDATATLNLRIADLQSQGLNIAEVQKKLFFEALIVDNMRQWRKIHLPIAFVFMFFSLLHILAIIFFA